MDDRTRNSTARASECLLSVSTALLLACLLIALGLLACAGPKASTQALSGAFCLEENSPFTEEELVFAAVATRDYTVGSNDPAALYEALTAINAACAEDGRAGNGAPSLESIANADGSLNLDAAERSFALADERYTLTPDAISHLDDVNKVIRTAGIAALAAAAACVAGLLMTFRRCGTRRLGAVLQAASIAVVAIFAALAAWVAFDFQGFFAAFHSLFFADGTWTFSYDSLLITMYPEPFWLGMGAIWLIATLAGCMICFIVGQLLRNNGRMKRN